MKNQSLFWPLTLIATGIVWLLVSVNVIPVANVWALTHLWPFILIVLGVGLILRSYVPWAGSVVTVLVVLGAVAAIVFAPQLGWAGGPDWSFDPEFGGGVPGSGKIETETREVEDFQAVSIRYPAEVVIIQGESESVEIETDDNLLPQISTDVRDGTLVIENNEDDWSDRVNASDGIKITITVQDVNEINFSSAGTLDVNGLTTDELDLSLSGAGEVNLNDVDMDSLEIRLSGAGNIEASGTADHLGIVISGLGDFEGEDLASLTADVRISGAGNATVRVQDDLTATVSGAGSIDYYGSPAVDENISGAGSIRQAGDE